jgi:hypothetical protein
LRKKEPFKGPDLQIGELPEFIKVVQPTFPSVPKLPLEEVTFPSLPLEELGKFTLGRDTEVTGTTPGDGITQSEPEPTTVSTVAGEVFFLTAPTLVTIPEELILAPTELRISQQEPVLLPSIPTVGIVEPTPMREITVEQVSLVTAIQPAIIEPSFVQPAIIVAPLLSTTQVELIATEPIRLSTTTSLLFK